MSLITNSTNKESKNKFILFGIKGKLLIGFFSVMFVFLISMIVTFIIIEKISNKANLYLANNITINQISTDLRSVIIEITTDLQLAVLSNDPTKINNLKILWNEVDVSIVNINQKVAQLNDDDIINKWAELNAKINYYRKKSLQLMQHIGSNNQNEILEMYKSELIPSIMQLSDAFNVHSSLITKKMGLLDLIDRSLRHGIKNIIDSIQLITHVLSIFFIISILISIIIIIITARLIVNPIQYAIDIANRIASGDRNLNINSNRNDETGSLLLALSLMYESIKNSEEQLTQNLTKVRHAIDDQSSGSNEQASSINEITASITEIEKSAFQTMNKAKSLGELAEKTRQSGQLGLESIQNSVLGMRAVKEKVQTIAQTILDLSKQTQQVGDITAVVNNLAQQSKMLALNASIEAAKAGDAGKGFAVVASEVKNLAEQSEQSTTEVQKILENIKLSTEKAVMVTEEGTKGVDSGLELIEQTGQVIQDLNQVIRETAMTSQQIEAAIRQESAAIEQITAGMGEINTVSSSFVESIKQTSSAMDDLSTLLKNLKSNTAIYK